MDYKCPQCGRTIRFQGLCLKCQKENEEKAILEMSAEELEDAIDELADDYDEDRCRLLIRLRGKTPKSSRGRLGRTRSSTSRPCTRTRPTTWFPR